MRTFVYPGSFDPSPTGIWTLSTGPLSMCDKLIVAVLKNNSKSPIFTWRSACSFCRYLLVIGKM
jgi:phosphopantetheine adenylyltransferase